ncbi:MAG: hypothetical protein BMS9Abin02_1240 [Anaerolineae bacterium]|nr:MAG: hypothetical protein BMS9Abin02_1240 [Anaerolineae bacterium]
MVEREINYEAFQGYLEEHKLMGTHCKSCGQLYLPPRPLCAHCHGSDMDWQELSGNGKLIAYTTVHIAPTAMIEAGYGRDNPYCVGVVQVDEGPGISAQIHGVDCSNPQKIAIGTRLKAAFIERGQDGVQQTTLVFESI